MIFRNKNNEILVYSTKTRKTKGEETIKVNDVKSQRITKHKN